jgi:hypothetical protein
MTTNKKLKIDLSIGPCQDVLRDIPDGTFDALVTDPPYGLGEEPDPVELLRGWIQEGIHAGSGKGFMGACYHPDTEILTEKGWKSVSEVTPEDKVLAKDPNSPDAATEYVQVAKAFTYPFDGVLLHIKSDSCEQMVTPNHKIWCPEKRALVRADSVGSDVVQENESGTYPSSIAEVSYQGEVHCCQLEKYHVLMSRLNGKPVWSGNSWDSMVPGPGIWREVLRTLKPGARGGVFSGTRTLHLMVASLRLAGFEIENVWGWTYGCFDEETLIYSDGKWVDYTNLQVGQIVRAFDPETGRKVNLPIQEVLLFPEYEDVAYRIKGIGVDQLVSHNHRVTLWNPHTQKYQTKVVDALIGSRFMVPKYQGFPLRRLGHVEVSALVIPKYKGPMWCVRVETGMVLIKRRGKISVSGNSGFPKSMNIQKGTLKRLKKDGRYGKDGESRCSCPGHDVYDESNYAPEGVPDIAKERPRTLILDEYDGHKLTSRVCSWCLQPDQGWVDSLDGLGTAVKPAYEPVVVCRRPLADTPVDYLAILEGYGFSPEQIEEIMTPLEPA